MESVKYKILLVDDEKDILEFVSYNLRKEGYEVLTARNGLDGIEIAKKVSPQLILLDVMMPEMDGIETCEEIRKIPGLEDSLIAFLTARGEDYSQVAGFEAGGDDYIIKPIKPKVLISRIKALLKRYKPITGVTVKGPSETIISHKEFVVDRDRFMVQKEGKELFLPRKEFNLLFLLISRPDKVFSREEIFQKIWGDDVIVGERTIDVHIRKLREKIGDKHIKTIKGIGYKFVD